MLTAISKPFCMFIACLPLYYSCHLTIVISVYFMTNSSKQYCSNIMFPYAITHAAPTSLHCYIVLRCSYINDQRHYSIANSLFGYMVTIYNSYKVIKFETRKGGGTLGRYSKQNYRPPGLCYHSPLSLPLLVYSPLFSGIKGQPFVITVVTAACPQWTS